MFAPQRFVRPSREIAWFVSIWREMSSSTSSSRTSCAKSQIDWSVRAERSAPPGTSASFSPVAALPATAVGSPSSVSSHTLVWRSSMQATATWPAPVAVTRT